MKLFHGPTIISVAVSACLWIYLYMPFAVCSVRWEMTIIGGNETSVYKHPWIVRTSKQGTFYCVGSLIMRKHITQYMEG